jgi:hypothetical protein
MLRTFCVLAFLTIASSAEAETISGIPRVVDGDTLVVGATKIRLEGIDAPETDQVCLNAKGDHWTCGIEARDRLQAHIEGQVVVCLSNSTDIYQRSLATCSHRGEDLNGWMDRGPLPRARWIGCWSGRPGRSSFLPSFSMSDGFQEPNMPRVPPGT